MPSANNNFADAIEVVIASAGGTYTSPSVDTTGNTTESGEPVISASASVSAWWKYTPTSSGTADFDTQLTTPTYGSTDTYMALWTGTNFGDMVLVASDDDAGGSGTSLINDFSVTADETYWIQIGGFGGVEVNLVLRVTGPETTGAPPPPTDPTVMASAGAALSTNDPAVTFSGYTPLENDVVVMFVSSTTVLDVVANASLPAGWVNPLGDAVEVNSDSNGMCALYHLVTAGEETAGTLTYTATNALAAAETGYVHGVAVRNVDPTAVIDVFETVFNSGGIVTPHTLPGLTSAGSSQPTVDDALVLSSVAKDATGAYSSVPGGWDQILATNTNQGRWTGQRTALTVGGVDIAATNITPSAGDEYVAITLALTPATPAPPSSEFEGWGCPI